MKKFLLFIFTLLLVVGCTQQERSDTKVFNQNTKVTDIINNSSFKDYGRLIFPVHRNVSNKTLKDLDDVYIWYNNMSVNNTVEIVNYMKKQVDTDNTIFYDIYTDEEKKKNSELNDTGLFFFKGKDNNKTAIINAGGGFMYVGAMQDSFPHALELSKKGYNAFALIYRPDSRKAMQDLSRAVAFLHENQKELKIDMTNYSVWGGSAGARMSVWLGNNGTSYYGEKDYPKPATVITQYSGISEVTGNEPPTYANVGTNDGIAYYQTMQNRINKIKQNGTNAEIEVFKGLSHGYGIGTDTVAKGWIINAIAFWERNMK